MKPPFIFFFAIVLGIGFSLCRAEEQYPIAGAGSISCGKWLEARINQDAHIDRVLTSWVHGFLSGVNTQRYALTKQAMLLLPDGPSVLAYVDGYCRDNPLRSVYEASISLYYDLNKSAATAAH